jgi:hypothetical protein
MKKVKDEPIILYQDVPQIQSLKHDLNELLPLAQKVCESYNRLPFAVKDAGFYDIISNTSVNAKTYLIRSLPDQVEISGLSFNKAKVVELGLIEVEGLADCNSAVVNFKSAGGEALQTYFEHKDGTAIINPVAWKAFENRHMISVNSESERELYNKLQNFLVTVEAFHQFMKSKYGVIVVIGRGMVDIGQFCIIDPQKGLIIKPAVFAGLIKRARSKQTE